MGLLRMGSTAVNDIVGQVANFEQMSDHLIMMTLGAAASLYGTHIINSLRVEAFKARQMGQYHLKERLGAGGMGEVYLAEHRLLKRPCAIKIIRPGSQADPAAIARFEREVRTTAKLSHWNTVNIFDYGRTDDGTFFYVMEYLHGWSLAELVQRHGPLPAARAIHLLRQACRALHEAHSAGLVHRDVKPANIFAARLGGVCDIAKLLDFGLVRHTADAPDLQLSQNGTFSGSPLYMAPEQGSAGREPDARSDIYSLGATAYYLLTGKPPFEGKTVVQVLLAHAQAPVVPPSRILPGIATDVEEVILRCLSKSPDERFADALTLERALARCQDADQWADADASRWWAQAESAPITEKKVPAAATAP
jgi:serine/threonine-protein kinase